MLEKLILIILSIFIQISATIGQDDECNQTIVGVSVEIVEGTRTTEFLENDFSSGDITGWNGFVTHMLVQILTEFEPEITFYSLEEIGEDCHYFLQANLDLGVLRDENYEYTGETGYYIIAGLRANANCIPNRNWDLDIYDAIDPNLKQAMKNMVSQFYPMDRNIVIYEKDHPSPPRDPELNIDIKKEYISPLDKESRKTKVNAEVYDCRGHLVCHEYHGQPVYYQDYIDRLDLKQTILGEGGYHLGSYMVIITNEDCDNEGEYKLEKGINAEKKKIRFKTCSLGGPIDDYVEEEKELIIRGLEIDVKPDRKAIKQNEQTKIVITFNEIDPEGSRYHIGDKNIDVKISGLSNGKITPQNGYTTNSEGKVILDYKAGSKDEKITVTASFQPEDYPDKVTGTGSVSIIPDNFAWSGNINIEITERFYCMEEEETSELGRTEVRANDEIRTLANISVGLEDFDMVGQSTNAGSMLRYASGNLTLNLREDHWRKGYAEKTQCHNENSGKWEWRSPGNWSTRHKTKSAIAYRDIKTENLIMLIMKDVGVDQASMENLQQQLQEAAQRMDMKAIESLKGEMTNMVQGDKNSNTFPVRIQVQLTFPGNITDLVSTTYASESNDVCNSDNTKRDSSSDAGEVNIVAPVTVMMEGSYTRGDDGYDIINASVNLSEQTQAGFFSNICPDKTVSLKANIQLKRKHE